MNDVPYSDVQARHPDLGLDGLPLVHDVPDEPPGLPTIPAAAPTALVLNEVDLLKYKLLLERVQRLQMQRQLATMHFQNTITVERETSEELGILLDTLGAKYNTDFHANTIDQSTGHIRPNK